MTVAAAECPNDVMPEPECVGPIVRAVSERFRAACDSQ
jgi:hypothetical protein